MTTILYGVYIVITVLLIGIILIQKSKTRGFGVTTGLANIGDSYYSKNKSKTYEGKLELFTKIGIFLFIVLAVVINFVINTTPVAPTTPIQTTTTEGTIPADLSNKPYVPTTGTTTTPVAPAATTPVAPAATPVAPVAPVAPAAQ